MTVLKKPVLVISFGVMCCFCYSWMQQICKKIEILSLEDQILKAYPPNYVIYLISIFYYLKMRHEKDCKAKI